MLSTTIMDAQLSGFVTGDLSFQASGAITASTGTFRYSYGVYVFYNIGLLGHRQDPRPVQLVAQLQKGVQSGPENQRLRPRDRRDPPDQALAGTCLSPWWLDCQRKREAFGLYQSLFGQPRRQVFAQASVAVNPYTHVPCGRETCFRGTLKSDVGIGRSVFVRRWYQ